MSPLNLLQESIPFYSLLNLKTAKHKRRQDAGDQISTIANETQTVKTYMDNSNGVRSSNSNAYNKVFLSIFITGSLHTLIRLDF